MTEETAKQLADAMNRLAAALEKLAGQSTGLAPPGIHVWHHGKAQPEVSPFQPYHPPLR